LKKQGKHDSLEHLDAAARVEYVDSHRHWFHSKGGAYDMNALGASYSPDDFYYGRTKIGGFQQLDTGSSAKNLFNRFIWGSNIMMSGPPELFMRVKDSKGYIPYMWGPKAAYFMFWFLLFRWQWRSERLLKGDNIKEKWMNR